MKEAILYEAGRQGRVNCFLCSHRCRIPEGKRGFCRVRLNRGGRLFSLVYGRIVAEHVDPIEKKPLYHFLPGTRSYSIATPGCNFRCTFCQNWRISQTGADAEFERLGYTEPAEVVQKAVDTACQSMAYTYTEPTIFMEYALDVAAQARQRGLKNVFVTNGYESPEAIEAMKGMIDAANVDLKAFSDDFYRKQCGSRFEPVLDAICRMHGAGIHVEVTTLVVPGQNDSEQELKQIAEFIAGVSPDVVWHVSAFHPDYNAVDLCPTPVSKIQEALQIGRTAGLRYVYAGNVRLTDGSDTLCLGCGHPLILRRGFGPVRVQTRGNQCPQCGWEIPVVFAGES